MSCNVDDKLDSPKLTISPILNSVDDKSEISISVAETLLTIWATEPLSLPTIFSPKILLVSNPNPEGNVNLSNVGDKVLSDSYTPIILTASGQFNDISLSSTRKP